MFVVLNPRFSARPAGLLQLPHNLSSHRSCSFSTSSSKGSGFTIAEPEKHANIVGTVPYHTSYTLLKHATPPSKYPPKLNEEFSPLGRHLAVQAAKRKAILNFWWDGNEHDEEAAKYHEEGNNDEQYPFITFYARDDLASDRRLGVVVRTGIVTSSQDSESFFDSPSPDTVESWNERHGVYLLVCTHGARDCRCSDRGVPLVDAIRKELSSRRKREGGECIWNNIRVGEVGHVGGHKYAPNLLVFPFGDWLSQLSPNDIPLLLDTISVRLQTFKFAETNFESGSPTESLRKILRSPLILETSIWRGRMGVPKEEQMHLFEKYVMTV